MDDRTVTFSFAAKIQYQDTNTHTHKIPHPKLLGCSIPYTIYLSLTGVARNLPKLTSQYEVVGGAGFLLIHMAPPEKLRTEKKFLYGERMKVFMNEFN